MLYPKQSGVVLLSVERAMMPSFSVYLAYVRQAASMELEGEAVEWLCANELAYLQTLSFRRRRESYLLGRYAAKRAIQEATSPENLPLRELEIASGVFGQPLLRSMHAKASSFDICITHSEHLAFALAFPSGHPMGIDIEPIQADRLPAILSQLTEEERSIVFSEGHPIARATSFWTAKESLSKVLKCGLMTPFEILETTSLTANGGLFHNFPQYQFLSVTTEQNAFAMTLPKNSSLSGLAAVEKILRREI